MHSFLRFPVQTLVFCLGIFAYVSPSQAARPYIKTNAIWVYPDASQPAGNPILNSSIGQALIASARASGVTTIYLGVYNSTLNANGRHLYDESSITNFVAEAREASMQVYAAYGTSAGAQNWPAIGCGASGSPSAPLQLLNEIAAYNLPTPTAPVYDPVTMTTFNYLATFNGVILDVETPTADQNLLDFYSCAQQLLEQNNLNPAVTMNVSWTNNIGAGGPAYQQILNLGGGFENVVILGNSGFAGTFGANDGGIVSADTPAVAFRNDLFNVLIGLSTSASDPQGFFPAGQQGLDYQAQSVLNQFTANGINFGGFAIQNYGDSYLVGTAAWPSTNLTFPTGPSVEFLATGPAESDVKIGAVVVSAIFPNNTNPGATLTVTPVNPETQTPTPTGFQLTNLAFDVSTTAVFTGPVTVCFTVPTLDPTVFAGLAVLHYIGGVAVNQTITSGPYAPNPIGQTICASVTSFSPFVLATVSTSPKSGSACNGVYNGLFTGNISVTSGQSCKFTAGGVTGNVTLNGGNLVLGNAKITGNVQIGGGTFSIGPGTSIGGNLQIQNMPAGTSQNQVCGTGVHGDLQFQNNGAAVLIGSTAAGSCAGNAVGGNLTIQNNTATAGAVGNTVGNNLTVQNNMAATIVNGNSVHGNLQDQNNSAATQVFGNTVGNNLQCQQDASITGGGNTAQSKQGECAAF